MGLFAKKSLLTCVVLGTFSAACSNGNNDLYKEMTSAGKINRNKSSQISESTAVSSQKSSESQTKERTVSETIGIEVSPATRELTLKVSASPDGAIVDMSSVAEARSAGYSDIEIIEAASAQSLVMSSEALSALALSKFMLRQYGASEVNGVLAMGLAAVERARAAGLKNNEIIAYARLQGISFGTQALTSLGLSKYILANYGASEVNGVLAMGLAAVERARAAGVKNNEIIAYAKLQGIYFGVNALASLGLSKYNLTQYGASVVNDVLAMGLAAVERAKAAGLTHDEIKAYAKLQGIYFGEKALELLGS